MTRMEPRTALTRKRRPTTVSSGNSPTMRQSRCQCGLRTSGSRFLAIGRSGGPEVADEAEGLKPGRIGRRGLAGLKAHRRHPRGEIGNEGLEVDGAAERFLKPREARGQMVAEEGADALPGLHLEIIH